MDRKDHGVQYGHRTCNMCWFRYPLARYASLPCLKKQINSLPIDRQIILDILSASFKLATSKWAKKHVTLTRRCCQKGLVFRRLCTYSLHAFMLLLCLLCKVVNHQTIHVSLRKRSLNRRTSRGKQNKWYIQRLSYGIRRRNFPP